MIRKAESRDEPENETGRDLFARLLTQKPPSTASINGENEKKPSLVQSQSNSAVISQLESVLLANKRINLEPNLFPNWVSNREIIEINGRVGVGKSELMMHLISRFLLPSKWNISIDKGGTN